MHTNHSTQADRQPLSAGKHFWLSFLAVITGLPIAVTIASVGSFLILGFFALMIAASSTSSGSTTTPISYTTVYGDSAATRSIAVVPVQGVILSGSAADPLQSLFGASFADGEKIKEELRQIAHDTSIRGVILEIDSPGGMITASKAIADGVEYYRNTSHNPIVAHVNGMGASGAYWAASSTDAIYAQQGSEVGSIGVIFGPLVTYRSIVSDGTVTTNEPITYQYFTAGRSKDIGSPYRELTEDEKVFLNSEVQDEYARFVSFVSVRRSIPEATIKSDIGALPYGTVSALKNGLLDKEMSKEEVYVEVARKAGLGHYNVKRVDSMGSFWGSVFGANGLLKGRLSASDRAAGRTRFCSNNLVGKPLVLDGDISELCK